MKENIIAVVPAAGLGKRFGQEKNKPFYPLLDKPLVVWALEIFQKISEIKEVIPVLKEADMEMGVEIFERYKLSKIRKIAPGGKERQDSVYSGLRAMEGKVDIVLIHDGARPLVDAGIVKKALSNISGVEGVVVGVPVSDTIKEVREGLVKRTLQRESIWAVQTPQLFRYDSILKAYDKAMQENFYSTDDSALLERFGGKVKMVMGSYSNIKITSPEDFLSAELLLRERSKAGS
ncbi:MAG TPA: 2-C-methyl-D-erythritol 4-phosphate cytidylyltransferase [Thermodesulfovibrionales bacterium]|nr:2-C-methyl-D-erythritol 4-phosphate cytidylyltransferase [Thermodesulfovibrionales bacterium]